MSAMFAQASQAKNRGNRSNPHPSSGLVPPLLFLLYVSPCTFETKQQLTGKGRVSAVLCSPVSSQVVQ